MTIKFTKLCKMLDLEIALDQQFAETAGAPIKRKQLPRRKLDRMAKIDADQRKAKPSAPKSKSDQHEWWDSLSPEQKAKYAKLHPNSELTEHLPQSVKYRGLTHYKTGKNGYRFSDNTPSSEYRYGDEDKGVDRRIWMGIDGKIMDD